MTTLILVEVLPGLELALLPCENVDEIGSQLEAFFDEVMRRPWLGDDVPAYVVGDSMYAQWIDEGSPTCGCDWAGDYSDVLPAAMRDDYIGD